jgi:transposase
MLMFNLQPTMRIFVCARPADMRCSFNGLYALVRNQLKQDPFSSNLFLFRSRRGNYLKVLWWEGDGFAIFAKKLEKGTFQFPTIRFVDGICQPIEIERRELLLLLEGIDTGSVKMLKRYRRELPKAA